MPYTQAHNVLQIIGTDVSEGEPEIWSNTIRFSVAETGSVTSSDPAALALINDDIEADVKAWWNLLASSYSANTKVIGFKFNGVGTDGKYLGQTNERMFSAPVSGSAGTSTSRLPLHLALAVTFHTNIERGLANRGRIYLPAMIASRVDNSGRLDATTATFVASSTATLLTNLANWPGIDALADGGTPAIFSKVREGAVRRINAVSVGDLWDSQTRRANALTENRTARQTVTS